MEYVVIHVVRKDPFMFDVYGPFANRQEAQDFSNDECPESRQARGEFDLLEPLHRRVRKIVKSEWADPEDDGWNDV